MTLLELLGLLKKNLKLVVILPLVCAIGMGAYAFMGMEDEYTGDREHVCAGKAG